MFELTMGTSSKLDMDGTLVTPCHSLPPTMDTTTGIPEPWLFRVETFTLNSMLTLGMNGLALRYHWMYEIQQVKEKKKIVKSLRLETVYVTLCNNLSNSVVLLRKLNHSFFLGWKYIKVMCDIHFESSKS